MEIISEDEKSPNYKNVLIDISIIVGFLDFNWHPIIIRKLLAFFAHNDIVYDKVQEDIGLSGEIQNQNDTAIKGDFGNQPSKGKNSLLLTCSESKYIYMRVGTTLKEINIILIQPILNLNLYEFTIKKGNIVSLTYVDHSNIYGSIDAFEIQELSSYPYTIKSQDDFKGKKNLMLSTKNKNSLAFNYTGQSKQCRLYDKNENVTSENNLTFKNVTVHFFQESVSRFFNYLTSEFVGSLSPSEKIVEYRKSKERLMLLTRRKTQRKLISLIKNLEKGPIDCAFKINDKSEFNSQKLDLNKIQYTFSSLFFIDIFIK